MNEFWTSAKEYQLVYFIVFQIVTYIFVYMKFIKTKNNEAEIERLDRTGNQTQMSDLIKIVSDSVKEQGKNIQKQSEATHELAVAVKEICTFVENDSRYHSDTLASLRASQNNFHKRMDRLQEVTIKEILQKLDKIDMQTSLCPKIEELTS